FLHSRVFGSITLAAHTSGRREAHPMMTLPIPRPRLPIRAVSLLVLLISQAPQALCATVQGTAPAAGGAAISGARVTLFPADTSSFREARTDPTGHYAFTATTPATGRIGAERTGFPYSRIILILLTGL